MIVALLSRRLQTCLWLHYAWYICAYFTGLISRLLTSQQKLRKFEPLKFPTIQYVQMYTPLLSIATALTYNLNIRNRN